VKINFNYLVAYSLEDGEIGNTVGCFTINQAKEIGKAVLDYYTKTSKVDNVYVTDIQGHILEEIK
jgi:hypothetical protein